MRFVLFLVAVGCAVAQQPAADSPYAPVTDTPGLPRVLLIGDSISVGYTIPVRRLLTGQANVHRPAENSGPTTRGVQNLEAWLGKGKWDVIHFNFGLHDLKTIWDGQHQVSVADYERNLRRMVARMRQTGAVLIWASTTAIPDGKLEPPRKPEDVVLYNKAALRVMKDNSVRVNDLYAFVKPRLAELGRPQNVHFTEPGSQALAEHVVKAILAAMPK